MAGFISLSLIFLVRAIYFSFFFLYCVYSFCAQSPCLLWDLLCCRCYEVLREWEFASYHCSLNLDSLEQQHGKTSSECANAVAKLAKFLYNGKLFKNADKVIDRGIKLLSLHYGEQHYALEELLKMKECVRNFSSPVSQLSL